MAEAEPRCRPEDVEQPEWRAALLAEAIRHSAHLEGPISSSALFWHLLSWLGLREEDCAQEIRTTLFLMVRSGLYTSTSHDPATNDIWLGGDTLYTASRTLTAYLHGEVTYITDEDEI